MKTLNKDDCEHICDLLYTLSVREKQSGVSVYRQAYGLKGLPLSNGSFTKLKITAMAENWVQVEDDPDIIDAEVDEEIELL